jgi:molybdopterin-guanine dinucleotide biosynthesis protein B
MNRQANPPKAVAIVGPSNSGKTELICRLLGWFQSQGLEAAVLKHSHKPNLGDQVKDTGRYRRAGAKNLALAGPGLLQITRCLPEDPSVEQVLAAWVPDADLILVEGYKSSALPKIALVGSRLEQVLPDFSQVIALVSTDPWESRLPVFAPHQVAELGRFIQNFLFSGHEQE